MKSLPTTKHENKNMIAQFLNINIPVFTTPNEFMSHD